jgi:hypothetical protein
MHWSFMAMKRFSSFTLTLAAVLGSSVSVAAAADAQMVNGRWQLPAKGATGARQGVVVEGPPARQPTLVPNPTAPIPGNLSYPQQAQPVQFTLVPAILMSDGSIFANFGFGYEPVMRSCVYPESWRIAAERDAAAERTTERAGADRVLHSRSVRPRLRL